MTTDNPTPDAAPEAQQAGALPPLSQERIDAIEDRVFSGIAEDRGVRTRRSVRRRRLWMGTTAAAAIVAVAAIISPSVIASLAPTNESGSISAIAPVQTLTDTAGGADGAPELSQADPDLTSGVIGGASDSAVKNGEREIVASSSATVVVDDVRAAAQSIADAATARGGYVESMSVGSGTVNGPFDISGSSAGDPEGEITTGWITVRVPADDLPAALAQLETLGEGPSTSSVNRYDVTDQVVDLQARVDAAQASVDRLEELMAQAGSVSDLIAAESALAERQADLESYQQQLESLQNQVALSSLNVSLTVRHEAVDANPAGFWDGVVAGWNGLIASLNGIVIALGFLLPWLVVVAIVGGAVWGIVTLVRRRRRRGRVGGRGDADA